MEKILREVITFGKSEQQLSPTGLKKGEKKAHLERFLQVLSRDILGAAVLINIRESTSDSAAVRQSPDQPCANGRRRSAVLASGA